MLDYLNFLAIVAFLAGIFISLFGIWRFIFNSERADALTRRLLFYSFSLAVLGSIAFVYYLTMQGNFLAFLMFPIFILLIAIVIYLIGSFLISGYLLFKDPGSLLVMRKRKTPAITAIVGILLIISSRAYLIELADLRGKYGSLTSGLDCKSALSEEEIKNAYSNWFFRNHYSLLRCLLFRQNVPQWILSDIYKNNKDPHVLHALLSHSNIDCKMFKQILNEMNPLENFDVKSKNLTGQEDKIFEYDFYNKNIVRCR